MNLIDLLNHTIYSLPLSHLPMRDKCVINTINAHSYCQTKKDPIFEKALLAGDILLPDGSGIVFASMILQGKKINKIAGADVHDYLLYQANTKAQKVFYLGASAATLALIENRVRIDFPNINLASYSPPYKAKFSAAETQEMLKRVNNFQPDILFVGMTAPKQEKWVFENREEINSRIIASVGAVFNFYAGTVKRPNKFWVHIGMEWLARTVREPRLIKRNLISIPKFVMEVLCVKFFGRGYLRQQINN